MTEELNTFTDLKWTRMSSKAFRAPKLGLPVCSRHSLLFMLRESCSWAVLLLSHKHKKLFKTFRLHYTALFLYVYVCLYTHKNKLWRCGYLYNDDRKVIKRYKPVTTSSEHQHTQARAANANTRHLAGIWSLKMDVSQLMWSHPKYLKGWDAGEFSSDWRCVGKGRLKEAQIY